MKLLPNVLVAIDFNESSENAMKMAITLAEVFSSKVHLVHVMHNGNLSSETENLLKHTIEDKLTEIKNKLVSKNINVGETIIESGVPFEKIIKTSLEKDANVIVVGAGNNIENEGYKLGTTTEKLIRKSPVPIWAVKNEEIQGINKIICPVDFSNASKRALNNAITFANRFNADLLIVNVFTPFHTSFTWVSEAYEDEENKQNQLKQEKELKDFLDGFKLDNTQYTVRQIAGEPAPKIVETINSYQPDLLIMGTTGKSELSRIFMGSVTAKVTRELLCNFITTKEKSITDDYLDDYLSVKEVVVAPAKTLLSQGKYHQAIDKFSLGLKQYPDCVPILIGLIKAYQLSGNEQMAKFYMEYANKVINRIWGEEYLNIIKLP